jgi:hypothetical protein
MPTNSNVLCGCGRFMVVKRNSVTVEELLEDQAPYKLWDADLYECVECGTEIITGFAQLPLAEHYQPTYAEQRGRLRPIYAGRCRPVNIIAAVLVLVGISGRAWAQDDPPAPTPTAAPQEWHTGEPVSLTVAMIGTVVAAAGFGLMLRTTGPCYCEPRTQWVVGGVIVVAAGVTMTWLGLRSRTITIAPTIAPHIVGATAVVQWGSPRARGR